MEPSGAARLTAPFIPPFRCGISTAKPSPKIPITKPTGEVYELVDQIQVVSRAVSTGSPLSATGEDGKWSVQMCLKAQESVERACAVTF